MLSVDDFYLNFSVFVLFNNKIASITTAIDQRQSEYTNYIVIQSDSSGMLPMEDEGDLRCGRIFSFDFLLL